MKTIFLYIFMVGLMFACLLEILRIGEKIKAPIDVDGHWIVDEQTVSAFKTNCSPFLFQNKNPEIFIEQSGKQLIAILDNNSGIKMKGNLANNKILFSGNLSLKKNDSDNVEKSNSQLSLNILIKKDKVYQLSGIWKNPGSCKEINFIATRKE